ncbi:lysozyme [Frigidibacter sp. MR17.24]|uniref:lysozyme n=1 Tax=Frigidibacter sp. MR17.24 TaxID=3127345 RepID=UPI003013026F
MLIHDWQAVLRHAWSIRLILLAAILSGLEVTVAMLPPDTLPIEPGLSAALAGLVSAAALVARILAQTSLPDFLKDDSGAVRLPRTRRGTAATTAALVVAMAVPTIRGYEGVVLKPYYDAVGVLTWCAGETQGIPKASYTRAECDSMLSARVLEFYGAIDACLPDLPVPMLAAFTSTAYNIGKVGFCNSTMAKRARLGDRAGACNAILFWDKGRVNGVMQRIRGLSIRREKERDLCLEGAAL